MENGNINDLAAKIAQLIATESSMGDLASIRSSLDKINSRLDKLESSHSGAGIPPSHSHKHPSLEKLKMLEGLADKVFGNEANAGTCGFEPGNKPCDHCSMCNSRGF